MKDDQRNYIVVGVFVLSMLAGLILWLAVLSGHTGATDDYYIVYDNVGSLAPGTEVLYEGYRVGLIEGISPVEIDGRRRFRVDVSVKHDWAIPDDSLARIYSSGLLSAAAIDIRGGGSQVALEPGARIPSAEASNVMDVVGELAENSVKPLVDTLGQSIPQILTEVSSFTSEANVALDRFKEILKPGNTQRLEQILVNLETTTDSAATAMTGLRETQQRLDDLLGKVNGLLDDKQGDVGLAVADLQHSLESVARHIDSITSNLEAASRNMNEFSRQIREDPSLVLRGREAAETSGAK